MTVVEAIKQLFVGAGVGWVMWLLGVLSVVSLAIIIERWLLLRGRSGDLRALADKLDARLGKGDVAGAIADMKQERAVAAAIAAAGLRLAHLGPGGAEKAMDSAVALERGVLEKRLAYLGTLGNNAPFVGLFGTVIGVIQAFEELGHGAPGHGGGASAASQVASQAVMTGIAEALVATAVGIAVALPAVAAYNYLQRRVASVLSGADVLSNLVLAYLSNPGDGPGGRGGASGSSTEPRGAPAVLEPSTV